MNESTQYSASSEMHDSCNEWQFFPSQEIQQLFSNTIGKLIGVSYYLIAFKHQPERIDYYKFLCIGRIANPMRLTRLYQAIVYTAENRTSPKIDISPIELALDEMPGNWKYWNYPVPDSEADIIKNLHAVKIKFTVYASTSQMMNDNNYCFLCELNTTAPDNNTFASLVFVIRGSDGNYQLKKIQYIK